MYSYSYTWTDLITDINLVITLVEDNADHYKAIGKRFLSTNVDESIRIDFFPGFD